ncbi:hypothetical protein AVEN_130616-1 [Araneus ventricosus]|uniref:Reverse transcriptase RNase H-like domain-containing protein n=1 Tax=Araneus ventricosus TaxID=182803 RepID=A0A4Y2LG68_ARAVE|nr:hypothetical protein AVEN_130616-1 [Araneus ventricosus]
MLSNSICQSKLTRCQQSWSTIEREAFAIVWCLKSSSLGVWILRNEFYTDHNLLPFLIKKGAPQSVTTRLAFALQRWVNITINIALEQKMPHAGCTSRLV